jgi:hypothetical protein
MQEVWKAVPGYEGAYEVSDQGRVRKTNAALLAQTKMRSGHVSVHLCRRMFYVHRLVLLTFVGSPADYRADTRVECRHLDGNPSNNCLDNLRWGTVKENRADRRRLGEKAKFTREQALQIQQECASGQLIKDVARKWGVDRHTVARYKNGYMYGDVD